MAEAVETGSWSPFLGASGTCSVACLKPTKLPQLQPALSLCVDSVRSGAVPVGRELVASSATPRNAQPLAAWGTRVWVLAVMWLQNSGIFLASRTMWR